jgi:chlorobactene glucosyltransferase
MMYGDPLLLPGLLVLLFVAALLAIAAINMRSLRRLSDYRLTGPCPRISALVPARNEETKIGACVESLLAQDYPDFQVVVLNDNSTDRTGEILNTIARRDGRLKVVSGEPLPPGWLGKHWACHQLYQQADGEMLVFTDSDTVHTPDTFMSTAAAMKDEKADMLSIVPGHYLGSLAERLVMPFFALAVFALVPLLSRFRPRKLTMRSASGKLLAFRRRSYEACGGFQGVRQSVLDDLELPQRIIAGGMRYRVFDGTRNVTCRMYHNWREVHQGLTKNVFAAHGYNVPFFIAAWLWILFVFWEPLFVVAASRTPAYPPAASVVLAAVAIAATLVLWASYYWRFRFPLYMVVLYPVSAVVMAAIAFSSMILTLSGKATWKERTLPSRKQC